MKQITITKDKKWSFNFEDVNQRDILHVIRNLKRQFHISKRAARIERMKAVPLIVPEEKVERLTYDRSRNTISIAS